MRPTGTLFGNSEAKEKGIFLSKAVGIYIIEEIGTPYSKVVQLAGKLTIILRTSKPCSEEVSFNWLIIIVLATNKSRWRDED